MAALGVGALALAPSEAKADIVYTDLSSSPVVVGYGSGAVNSFPLTLPTGMWSWNGTATVWNPALGAKMGFFNSWSGGVGSGYRNISAYGGYSQYWAVKNNKLQLFGAGQNWGAKAGARSGTNGLLVLGLRFTHTWSYTWIQTGSNPSSGHTTTRTINYTYPTGNGGFPAQYAQFAFYGQNGMDYGWVELAGSIANDNDNIIGPNLTVLGYAYDDSGKRINTGDLPTPEPGTLALTGLSALALGAVGLRRWRAARKAKAV